MKKLIYFASILFLLPMFQANAQWNDVITVVASNDVTNNSPDYASDDGTITGLSFISSLFEARVYMYIYRSWNDHPWVQASAYGWIRKPSGTSIGFVYANESTSNINVSVGDVDPLNCSGARSCEYELNASVSANTEGYAVARISIDWSTF